MVLVRYEIVWMRGRRGELTTQSSIISTTINYENHGDIFLRFAQAIDGEFLHRNTFVQVSTAKYTLE